MMVPAVVAVRKRRPVVPEGSHESVAENEPASDDNEFTAFFVSDFGPLTAYCGRSGIRTPTPF